MNLQARVCLALILSVCATAFAQPPAHIAQAFESEFRAIAGQQNIPGAAFAVVSGGQVVSIGTVGYTGLDRRQPIDENTVFRIASVSKGFAATLAAMMVEEGRFGWGDPVTRYRPDFQLRSGQHSINIEHLLSHSTGIVSRAYDHLLQQGHPVDQILPRFSELSLECSPGSCYRYQNVAFSLIESILETAGGTGFDQLMDERIFQPLDMNRSSVGYEAWHQVANRAEPHVNRDQQWRTGLVNRNYYRVNSAAGINASILDMAKWLIANLGYKPEVIPPTVVDHVTRPRTHTAQSMNNRHWKDYLTDAHYGLGWRVYRFGDVELAFHGGWVHGFRAEASFSREHDLGLVILINAETGVIGELSTLFWSRALGVPNKNGTGHATSATPN